MIAAAIGLVGLATFLLYLLKFTHASRRDPLTARAENPAARQARWTAGMYVRREEYEDVERQRVA